MASENRDWGYDRIVGLGAHQNGPTCAHQSGPSECAAASHCGGSSTESIGGYLWTPVDEPGGGLSAGQRGGPLMRFVRGDVRGNQIVSPKIDYGPS